MTSSTLTGIVVPTLGTRVALLRQCLQSIRSAGDVWISVVCPENVDLTEFRDAKLVDQVVTDPEHGLTTAINTGIMALPESIIFVNWLGDDDLLTAGSLNISTKYLIDHPNTSLVYGGCNYIDLSGNVIWSNKSGNWSKGLMRIGPQLIPQPGALFRRNAFLRIGGLSEEYKWAFDLDLLMKLARIGKLSFVPEVLACFRWHGDSLSVGGREGSVREASEIRKQNLPVIIRWASELWEFPLRILILQAGKRMSKRLA